MNIYFTAEIGCFHFEENIQHKLMKGDKSPIGLSKIFSQSFFSVANMGFSGFSISTVLCIDNKLLEKYDWIEFLPMLLS